MDPWLTRRVGSADASGPGVTVHTLAGTSVGPHVVILGAVHGDETQGARACLALLASLGGSLHAGRVSVVPVSHEAAFGSGTRVSPLDGGNLARAFPGAADGSQTDRTAYLLRTQVIDDADLLLDLHSSGIHYSMPLLIGYCDDGSPASLRAAELATVAGLPVTWRHPGPPAAGRTGTDPHGRGVPFLYLESPEAEDHAPAYAAAVLRMLAEMGMTDAGPGEVASSIRLAGPGDLDDDAVRATAAGLVEVHPRLLDQVQAGDVVAVERDPWHGSRSELRASASGVVVMRRETRRADPGDLLLFLTGADDLRS